MQFYLFYAFFWFNVSGSAHAQTGHALFKHIFTALHKLTYFLVQLVQQLEVSELLRWSIYHRLHDDNHIHDLGSYC